MPRHAKKSQSQNEVVERVDDDLVTKAVKEIKDLLDDTLTKAVMSVGEYVLKTFFNNDVELVRSREAKKGMSFRALAQKCGSPELPISTTWLYTAVSIVAMRRTLPQGAFFKALPPSHQTALLPLREYPDAAEKLAQKALTKRLSVRALREDVLEAVAKTRSEETSRGGRPKKPVVVKTLDRTAALFAFDGGRRAFTKGMVDELDDAQARAALKIARTLVTRLEGLIEKLEAR